MENWKTRLVGPIHESENRFSCVAERVTRQCPSLVLTSQCWPRPWLAGLTRRSSPTDAMVTVRCLILSDGEDTPIQHGVIYGKKELPCPIRKCPRGCGERRGRWVVLMNLMDGDANGSTLPQRCTYLVVVEVVCFCVPCSSRVMSVWINFLSNEKRKNFQSISIQLLREKGWVENFIHTA